jgi:hypothetical protein
MFVSDLSKLFTFSESFSNDFQIGTFALSNRTFAEFLIISILFTVIPVLLRTSPGNLQMGTGIDGCLRLVERLAGLEGDESLEVRRSVGATLSSIHEIGDSFGEGGQGTFIVFVVIV